MISINGSTKTWSDSQQETSWKSDNIKSVSAEDFKKHFGDKDIGEVLNKVSDPNWVDPSKTRKVGENQLDKDSFLKLLLTQLKYQNPTNPMESHEMAAQLAQFSSLESLSNIDKGISNLQKVSQPKNNFAALNLIGKFVSGDSSKISRMNEEDTHLIRYDLMNKAQKVSVKIFDANNQKIRELTYNDVQKGKNEISWNGNNENGQVVRPGEYRVQVDAVASNGQKVGAITQFEGKISGINFTAKGPVLLVGNQSIRLTDVKRIMDSSTLKREPVERPQQNSIQETKSSINRIQSDQLAPTLAASNMESVGMSREMLNQIEKQGVKVGR